MSFDAYLFDAYPSPVWRVELEPALAAGLRRKVGCDRRAARFEEDFQGWPVPADARLLRVEADAPVGVFVEATWPHTDHRYRGAQLWRRLREAEPVSRGDRPATRDDAVTLGEVAWFGRKHGLLSDELTKAEVELARHEAEVSARGRVLPLYDGTGEA